MEKLNPANIHPKPVVVENEPLSEVEIFEEEKVLSLAKKIALLIEEAEKRANQKESFGNNPLDALGAIESSAFLAQPDNLAKSKSEIENFDQHADIYSKLSRMRDAGIVNCLTAMQKDGKTTYSDEPINLFNFESSKSYLVGEKSCWSDYSAEDIMDTAGEFSYVCMKLLMFQLGTTALLKNSGILGVYSGGKFIETSQDFRDEKIKEIVDICIKERVEGDESLTAELLKTFSPKDYDVYNNYYTLLEKSKTDEYDIPHLELNEPEPVDFMNIDKNCSGFGTFYDGAERSPRCMKAILREWIKLNREYLSAKAYSEIVLVLG